MRKALWSARNVSLLTKYSTILWENLMTCCCCKWSMQMGEPRLNPTLNRLFLLSMFYFFKPPPKYLTLIVCVCVSVHIHGHNDMLSVVMFLIYSDLGDFFFFCNSSLTLFKNIHSEKSDFLNYWKQKWQKEHVTLFNPCSACSAVLSGGDTLDSWRGQAGRGDFWQKWKYWRGGNKSFPGWERGGLSVIFAFIL